MKEKRKEKNKKGQLTIYIIIAIFIVAIAILIYFFYDDISSYVVQEENPTVIIQTCLEDELEDTVTLISSQGGSLAPQHYIMYNNQKTEYLCYTNEYYVTCVMQQPMLKEHIESEIQKGIKKASDECFNDLEEYYKNRGYTVSLKRNDLKVELLPKRIVTTFEYPLTLTKGETKKYNSIKVVLNNNLYELVSIANSILNWEARYGDSETTIYMDYYHDLKVEKLKQGEGSTIYILTDRNNGNQFQFASRSLAWPPGYGTSVI